MALAGPDGMTTPRPEFGDASNLPPEVFRVKADEIRPSPREEFEAALDRVIDLARLGEQRHEERDAVLALHAQAIESAERATRELTFRALRAANTERCTSAFHPIEDWSPTDWACAVAGEVGEACNLIKKMRRGDLVQVGDIADEIADAVIYLDLLAERLGIDLDAAVVAKFNEVSARKHSPVWLLTSDTPRESDTLRAEVAALRLRAEVAETQCFEADERAEQWKERAERAESDRTAAFRRSEQYRKLWEELDELLTSENKAKVALGAEVAALKAERDFSTDRVDRIIQHLAHLGLPSIHDRAPDEQQIQAWVSKIMAERDALRAACEDMIQACPLSWSTPGDPHEARAFVAARAALAGEGK